MMMYDGLWPFIMFSDGLSFFMMMYDDVWWFIILHDDVSFIMHTSAGRKFINFGGLRFMTPIPRGFDTWHRRSIGGPISTPN